MLAVALRADPEVGTYGSRRPPFLVDHCLGHWRKMSAASGSWASRPHALSRTTAGRLNTPRPALVEAGGDGTPPVVKRPQGALVREGGRGGARWGGGGAAGRR